MPFSEFPKGTICNHSWERWRLVGHEFVPNNLPMPHSRCRHCALIIPSQFTRSDVDCANHDWEDIHSFPSLKRCKVCLHCFPYTSVCEPDCKLRWGHSGLCYSGEKGNL